MANGDDSAARGAWFEAQAGFLERARAALRFLEDELGFALLSQADELIYGTDNRRVEVYLEGRSASIYGGVAALGEHTVGFHTIADYFRYDLRIDVGAAKSPESLDRALGRLAGLLSGPARPVLEGDEVLFDKLRARTRQESQEVTDGWLRSDLQKAWEERNFLQVVELSEQLERPTPFELRRLDYAKKKLRLSD